MRIGIYNEPSGRQPGGAEYMLAVLADGLSHAADVEFLHHNPSLTRDQIVAFTGTSLHKVKFRYLERDQPTIGSSRRPWVRYAEARDWHRHLSAPYDIFINCTHTLPPFCAARVGVLLVLFPFEAPSHAAGVTALHDLIAPGHAYGAWEWKRRLATYPVKIAISEFTRTWTRAWWGVDSVVIPPPVDAAFAETDKASCILSVGRFSGGSHSKRQLEMAAAFANLVDSGLAGWEYVVAGGLSEAENDQRYVSDVRAAARGASLSLRCNAPRSELVTEYERAMIFWHGAGYSDPIDKPQFAEHFGISTVEAMAAGCVPIVFNRGGQREIVEHGVTGFLWDTLEELQKYTTQVARDPELRMRLAKAARRRAQDFRRERFVAAFTALLPPLSREGSFGARQRTA
jgi:glycosyltransferase involved in cell wall biosynthesis